MRTLLERYAVFLKYSVVGALGTAVDLGSLYLFVEFLHLPVLLATALSFLLAVINNFLLNKHWTFQNKSSNIQKQFIKFLLVSLVGLALTELFMVLFVYGFKIWYMAAKLMTSGLVLIWNFLANKYWTFRDRIYYVPSRTEFGHDVSVIVPAYNEERRIRRTLETVDGYFRSRALSREIIVIDDGSSDGTAQVVGELARSIPGLRVISYRPNRGKGHAVRRGVEESDGRYILFTDADNSTPIEEFDRFLPLLPHTEVVIGSRYLEDSNVVIRQPWYRVLIGRFANALIRFFILDGIRDTQCGFKAFQHDAAQVVFSRMKVQRFGFDIEALAIARLFGFSVRELPVSWYNSAESRVKPLRDSLRTFRDLVYIKLNLWGGRYL